ncbi:hypothetical protein BHE90_008374 [Fusarium euwallaceae]|uniref:Uncharacterized protein n=1 Tax=Fusarium euwallaceae TaxID=1147111 RepID=A0A430LN62_9HYPO|nr:hypothetical protein BHE90_008374 [Fusarium euwallaceae]
MNWRTHAYQPLHIEKSHKKKPRPETESSKCRVLYLFKNTAGTPSHETQEMKNQELVEWLRGLEETEPEGAEPETEPQSYRDGFRLL